MAKNSLVPLCAGSVRQPVQRCCWPKFAILLTSRLSNTIFKYQLSWGRRNFIRAETLASTHARLDNFPTLLYTRQDFSLYQQLFNFLLFIAPELIFPVGPTSVILGNAQVRSSSRRYDAIVNYIFTS